MDSDRTDAIDQAPAPDDTLATAVRLHVLRVYAATGRNKAKTAERLRVSLKTLYAHLNRYVAAGHLTREEAGLRW